MNVTSATSLSNVDTQLVVGASTNNTPAPTSEAPGAPAKTNISGPGRMFHELSELSKSDPTKFKQVVSDMANTLRADAKSASGDQASRLSQLADRLDKVAQSGNLSDMAPQRGSGGEGAHHAHHGGGHHHGGGEAFSDLESAFTSAMSNSGNGAQAPTPAG